MLSHCYLPFPLRHRLALCPPRTMSRSADCHLHLAAHAAWRPLLATVAIGKKVAIGLLEGSYCRLHAGGYFVMLFSHSFVCLILTYPVLSLRLSNKKEISIQSEKVKGQIQIA